MLLSNSRLSWLCFVGTVGLGACGGVSRVDRPGLGDDSAGSSSSGADGAGRGGDAIAGDAAGGNASAGAPSAGAPSAGGAGTGGECSIFQDQAPQLVVVTIRNSTQAPVYIGSRMPTCGATPLFEVSAGGVVLSERGLCGTPCQGYLDGDPVGGCPAICQIPAVTRLAPGEIITTEWSGLYLLDTPLPNECNSSGSNGSNAVTCSVEKRAAPATYLFQSAAGSGVSCTGNPSGCTECQPAITGGCTFAGGTVTGTEIDAKLTVALDASYGISGSSGGGSNGAGQNRQVELVFLGPLL